MSDCKVFRREIGEASGRGDLAGPAAAHVTGCRACGEVLREREAVSVLVGGLARVEAPADFEFRLRARMAAAEVKGRRGPFGGLRLVFKFAPVAVAAAFLVVAGALYLRQPARSRQAAAPTGTAREVAAGDAGAQATAPPARVGSQNLITAPPVTAPVAADDRAVGRKSHVAKTTAPRRQQHLARRATETARAAGGAGEVATLNTTVSSVSSAEVIRGRTLSIPMETGAAPLRILLRDERGALRVVPVRPVSFGAQDVIAREGTRRRTNAVDDEGVW